MDYLRDNIKLLLVEGIFKYEIVFVCPLLPYKERCLILYVQLNLPVHYLQYTVNRSQSLRVLSNELLFKVSN